MKYIKGIQAYQDQSPSEITLGKFDGLHLGHQLLVSRIIEHQKYDGVVGIVFAFDMTPMLEKTNQSYQLLLTNEEKASRLEKKVDYFIDCPFDDTISGIEAEDFIRNILVDKFHVKYVVIGTDFRFGHEKRGDYRMLQDFGREYEFTVEVIPKKRFGEREISSTYIKELLASGQNALANELLGYDYTKI